MAAKGVNLFPLITRYMQRRRRFRRGGLPPNSTLSFLSRELREGQLHPLLRGVSSRGVAANSAVSDPLLSSFVYNLSISESNEDQIKPIVSSEESSMKKSLDV